MSLVYKKIAEVQLWHDYYLAKDASDMEYWLDSYNILNDIDFIPTPACQEALKNNKIVFKKTSTGFQLFARVVPSNVNPSLSKSFIFLDDQTKFDFFIEIKHPYFFNFTNIRFTDQNKIFYFSNKGKAALPSGDYFLTVPHPNVASFSIGMQVGDIVENGGNLHELNKNISVVTPFNNTDAFEIGDNQRRYTTTQDALKWQGSRYKFNDQNNPTPGEIVQFSLIDENGNNVNLGKIPGTNQKQSEYRAPLDGTKPLNHIINLSEVKQGKYTMNVNRVSGVFSEDFYLLGRQVFPNAFGVITLTPTDVTSGFINNQNDESIIDENTYQIRFKNRTTLWQYFDKDKTPMITLGDEDFQPLQQQPTEYELPLSSGGSIIAPDPDISIVYPETNVNGVVEKIYSKTYLNRL